MKHSCDVPAATSGKRQTWKCPVCRKTWDYKPKGNAFPDSFYGDTRDSSGRPVKKGWFW